QSMAGIGVIERLVVDPKNRNALQVIKIARSHGLIDKLGDLALDFSWMLLIRFLLNLGSSGAQRRGDFQRLFTFSRRFDGASFQVDLSDLDDEFSDGFAQIDG